MTNFDELKKTAGKVSFRSSEKRLVEGFQWAKEQALAYAHFGEDPVGLWYEAALPGRESFCIRDISHQSTASKILGLDGHTKNMLYHFMINISQSKDYCTYWEITREGKPTPVDYTSDEDFWYNLPANFDLIRTCYQQYLWTGDGTFLTDPAFTAFYSQTVHEYVNTWDKDRDGVPEYYPEYGRRGISSYNEAGFRPFIGGDLIAVQHAGYASYAEILKCQGKTAEAEEFREKARQLRQLYVNRWWNEKDKRFYGAIGPDRSFYREFYGEGNFLAIYFGIVNDMEKLNLSLQDTYRNGVKNAEGMTHLPEIYYRYGLEQQGYESLLALIDPELDRREYPEVSFCAVSSMVTGMMGIQAEGEKRVSTLSRLDNGVEWAEIADMPVYSNEVTIKHAGKTRTEFINISGDSLSWKAAFQSPCEYLILDGRKAGTEFEIGEDGKYRSFIRVEVKPGERHVVEQLNPDTKKAVP